MFLFQNIMKYPSLLISLIAILVMVYCLWLVLSLKAEVPGGVVGRQWTVMSWLVGLFTIGYLTTPFFSRIPVASLNMIASLIFLFGAIYVLITVKMIYRIIRIMSE